MNLPLSIFGTKRRPAERSSYLSPRLEHLEDRTVPTVTPFNLSSLLAMNGGNGTSGFVVNGVDAGGYLGTSVSSAGDINGDGYGDLVIGASAGFSNADPNATIFAGKSYVIFGKPTGFTAGFDLQSLNGNNGFVINGINGGDRVGNSVSSGDINGDGFDDLVIGASLADPNGVTDAGQTYVIFGKATGFSATLNLTSLNGTNGFTINGVDIGDVSGFTARSGGDLNGDGFDDVIIGAYRANSNSGESYVVFGKASGFSATLNLSSLDGNNGFTINSAHSGEDSGFSVDFAGDVNDDGFGDLIIGAPTADPNGQMDAGKSYVIFGKASGFGASFNLSSLNGTNGFVINGANTNDNFGWSVSSAGDVNGDGFDDIIIGARLADPNGSLDAGKSYVILGKATGFAATLNLPSLNGTNGFAIQGINIADFSGHAVSSAGDINDDGFDDLIIGARYADPNGHPNAGASYIVFGKSAGFGASLNLSDLNGINGFVINGINSGDEAGWSVRTAGDLNGDGFDDIVIGAWQATPNGLLQSGQSYVIFGGDLTRPLNNSAPIGDAGGPYHIVEGGVLSLDASQSHDPDGDNLTYSWDINNDGNFGDAVGPTPTLSWNQLVALGLDDGFATIDVRVRVGDGQGHPTTSSPTTLTIANTAPTIALSGNTTVDEGSLYTLTLGAISDPGMDTVTQRIVNWGDGTSNTYSSSGPVTHIFADSGNRIIKVDLVDEDGMYFAAGSLSVAVGNLNPSLSLNGDLGSDVGMSVTILANVTDPSSVDQASAFQFEIDWQSDGIVDELVSGSSNSNLTHAYSSPGAYQVSVVAIDKDGGRSATAVWGVDVSGFEVVQNAQNPLLFDLLGHGSSGDDELQFVQVDSSTILARWLEKNGTPISLEQTFSGVTGLILFDAGSGDDAIDASQITDNSAYLFGSDGNDFIYGTQGADSLSGGNGLDTIYGNLGNDFIEGGDGDDLLFGENTQSAPPTGYLYGIDTISGGGGNDRIYGDTDGGEGAGDLLSGGDGDDVIFGDGSVGSKAGNDTIGGGSGNDVITADGSEGSQDIVYGDGGDDLINTGGGNDIAFGNAGNDVLLGGDGGEGADDQLFGGDGQDILIGDGGISTFKQRVGGADVLDGGTGEDVVLGGMYIPLVTDSIGLIQSEWSSSRDFAIRVQNILGQGIGPRANGDSFLQLGTTTFNDRSATGSSNLVDVVLGGDQADWLLLDQSNDASNDLEPIDVIYNLATWPLPPA